MLCLLSGCDSVSVNEEIPMNGSKELTVPSYQQEYLDFDFDTASGQFLISDARNGKTWSNGMTDEYYRLEITNKNHQRNKMSLYSVTYMDSDGNVGVCRNTDSAMSVEYSAEGESIIAHSYIEMLDIRFDVVFSVQGNTLVVTVPAASVEDEGQYQLLTLELLPFLGASVKDEDGYIFYPDGSGAIYKFGEKNANTTVTTYQRQVYGDYFCDYDDYLNDVETGVKTVMLPVFGIKQGNGAILGAITKGQADSTITMYPFGYIYDAARVSATYNYRYLYEMETMAGRETILVTEADRSRSDFQVQYTFLANEDANYSGMARVYRQFLLDNGLLNQAAYTPEVSLDYLLSLKKPVLFWTENVSAATFDDVTALIQELNKSKIANLKVNLLGWQKEGYNVFPAHFPVSTVCGGKNGLKKLLTQADAATTNIALSDNFILAQKKQDGYSKRKDLALNLQHKVYVDNSENDYLLDFRSSMNQFTNHWLDNAKSIGAKSINLDDIARLFYANGSKDTPLRRSQAEVVVDSMLAKAGKEFDCVGVSGGNQYGLKYADYLYDIPESSSQDFLFDYDIPFFQMIVHGSVAYSPEIPGNFSNNYKETLLKWAEYGFVPYFSVSNVSATQLKDCYNEGVLISYFGEVKETIIDTVVRFNDSFADLRNVKITDHFRKENGLSETVYENGVRVLVNHSDQPISDGEIVVKAEDYLVLK